jgi:hypothetical protein
VTGTYLKKSPEETTRAAELYKSEKVLGVEFLANEDATLPSDRGEAALDERASHRRRWIASEKAFTP